jgi:acetylornithine deacetylase/succinyl-diaminopimelate desuccinylase-like protein
VIENGYLFGRGASDNKGDISMVVATLAKLKRAGWKPGRDVILGLSGDEETEQFTAAKMAEELKNAELVLNDDAGGGRLDADVHEGGGAAVPLPDHVEAGGQVERAAGPALQAGGPPGNQSARQRGHTCLTGVWGF